MKHESEYEYEPGAPVKVLLGIGVLVVAALFWAHASRYFIADAWRNWRNK